MSNSVVESIKLVKYLVGDGWDIQPMLRKKGLGLG